MLYNPKWSTTPSLDGFIAWLREQDPTKAYSWIDNRTCAVGQYFAAIGTDWNKEWAKDVGFVIKLDGLCQENKEPTLFGKVLERALAYRASL